MAEDEILPNRLYRPLSGFAPLKTQHGNLGVRGWIWRHAGYARCIDRTARVIHNLLWTTLPQNRHSGGRAKRGSPESRNIGLWNMDSGLAAVPRPGMTGPGMTDRAEDFLHQWLRPAC